MDKNLVKAFRTIIHNCLQISTKSHGDRMQVQEIWRSLSFRRNISYRDFFSFDDCYSCGIISTVVLL